MENFKLNDRVIVFERNVKGKIAFIGETQFADGVMFGIELDEPKGKYNGTVNSVRYFKCKKNHGTFVRECQLEKDLACSLEDWGRPRYPNYLKESSSKLGINSREKPLKSGNGKKKIKVKATDSPNVDVSRSEKLLEHISTVSQNVGVSRSEKLMEQILTNLQNVDVLRSEKLAEHITTAVPNVDVSSSVKLVEQITTALSNVDVSRGVKLAEQITTALSNVDVSRGVKLAEQITTASPNFDVSRSDKLAEEISTYSPDVDVSSSVKLVEQITTALPNIDASRSVKLAEQITAASPNLDVSRSEKLMDKTFQEGDSVMDQISQSVRCEESERKLGNLNKVLGKLAVTEQKLYEEESKREVVQEMLRHGLKSQDRPPNSDNSKKKAINKPPNSPNTTVSKYWGRPAFPKNLKESISELTHNTKKNPPKSENIDALRSEKLLGKGFQEGDHSIKYQINQPICFDESEKNAGNLKDKLEELAVTKRMLSEQEMKIKDVGSHFQMLKIYLKMNGVYEKSTSVGDDQTGHFIQLLIANEIKKIQDIISGAPKKKHLMSSSDVSAVLKEENNFLLMYVGDLEKRNAVLANKLAHLTDILERYSLINQCESTETTDGEGHDKHPRKKCLPTQSFTDKIKHEACLFKQSNHATKTKSTEIFPVEKFLETLSASKDISNQKDVEFWSPKVDKNTQPKDRSETSTNDSAKELKEFISKMMPNFAKIKKLPISGNKSSLQPLNGFAQMPKKFARDTSTVGDFSAQSNSSNKSKCLVKIQGKKTEKEKWNAY